MVEKMRSAEDFRIKSIAELSRNKDDEISHIRSQLHQEQLKMLSDQKAQMEESQERRIRELRVVWKQARAEFNICIHPLFNGQLFIGIGRECCYDAKRIRRYVES
jgi:hypothetical protein